MFSPLLPPQGSDCVSRTLFLSKEGKSRGKFSPSHRLWWIGPCFVRPRRPSSQTLSAPAPALLKSSCRRCDEIGESYTEQDMKELFMNYGNYLLTLSPPHDFFQKGFPSTGRPEQRSAVVKELIRCKARRRRLVLTSIYCNILNVKLHRLHSKTLTQAFYGELRSSIDVIEEYSCKQKNKK